MAKKKSKAAKKSSKASKKIPKKTVSKTPVQPVGDRVLVKREDVDVTSPAGIIIPDTAKTEKSKRGVIVAVGPGRYGEEADHIPMTVKVGDRVFFNSGWDNEVKIGTDDEEYFLVRESDILAIIN
jgi:chaperonin GroES